MNSKISFFNKSIIKSDLKRFWWLSVLFALGILAFFVFPYIYDLQNMNISFYATTNDTYTQSMLFTRGGNGIMSLSCIFPVALATLLFSYLNSPKSVACLHGLPIKRHEFFASHFLSGSILLIIPIIVNSLILLLFRFDKSIAESFTFLNLVLWSGEFILYSLLIYSFSSLIATIVGNSVATIIFSYIFALLPYLAEIFINFFLNEQVYGYDMASSNVISSFIYVFPEKLANEPLNILKYLIFIIVFLSLSIFSYKKRNLENNCEVVAFPKLKPIFVYGVAICAGAIGYAYLNALMETKNILLLIPFGIVGIIAAEMIVKKSLRVKSAIKPLLYYIIAVFVLLGAVKFDITGFERRVPDPDNILWASYEANINNQVTTRGYTNDGEEIIYDNEDMSIKSPTVIKDITELHKNLIEERIDTRTHGDYSVIKLRYALKNGRMLSREYFIDYAMHKDTLEPVIESEEIRKQYFPILKDSKRYVNELRIEDDRLNGHVFRKIQDEAEINKIIDILKQDTMATDYEQFARRTDEMTSIRIEFERPAKYSDGTPVPRDMLPEITETYYIRDDYEATKAMLKEMGFYEALPTADDVEGIGIDYYNEGRRISVKYTTEEAISFGEHNRIFNKALTDRNDIKTAYDYLINADDMNYSAYAEIYFKNGYTLHISFDADAENLPDILRNN